MTDLGEPESDDRSGGEAAGPSDQRSGPGHSAEKKDLQQSLDSLSKLA